MCFDEFKDYYVTLEAASNGYHKEVKYAQVGYTKSKNPNYLTKVINALEAFFESVISSMKSLVESMRSEIEKKKLEKTSKEALKKLKERAQESKNSGKRNILMVDYYKIADTLSDCAEEMWSDCHKILKRKYTDIAQMEKDYAKIEKSMETAKARIDKIRDRKIVVDVDDAIAFVERESGGSSHAIAVINDSVYKMRTMNDEIKKYKRNMDTTMDHDLLPRKLNFVQRIVHKIVGFVGSIGKILLAIIFALY